jgi:hypothetical protein
MSDYTLPPALTVIAGMTGSGKSTFAYRHLINTPAAAKFIFDDLGRAAVRLRLRPCFTAPELEAALPSRWIIFNPHRMFPGDPKAAFKYFCQWVYDASRRGPGKKLFLVDEVWQWQDNMQIPRELALVVQTGREENIELVCATQLPHKVNASITGQSSELVCFRLGEPLALARVRELGADADVSALPLGSFVSYNRLQSGPDSQLAGRVF